MSLTSAQSDRGQNDSNSIIWDSGSARPSSLVPGDTVRFVLAEDNSQAEVMAYCQTQAVDRVAINQVGDPGVLANLLTAATGGLRQEHELEIRCGVGRGRVEVTIENWVTTQSILRRS